MDTPSAHHRSFLLPLFLGEGGKTMLKGYSWQCSGSHEVLGIRSEWVMLSPSPSLPSCPSIFSSQKHLLKSHFALTLPASQSKEFSCAHVIKHLTLNHTQSWMEGEIQRSGRLWELGRHYFSSDQLSINLCSQLSHPALYKLLIQIQEKVGFGEIGLAGWLDYCLLKRMSLHSTCSTWNNSYFSNVVHLVHHQSSLNLGLSQMDIRHVEKLQGQIPRAG